MWFGISATLSFIAPSAIGIGRRDFTAFALHRLGQDVYRLEKPCHGWNVDGSASHNSKSPSWIVDWEIKTGLDRSVCSYEDCTCKNPRALVGGHLWIKTKGAFIAPICRSCNHYRNLNRAQDPNGKHSFIRANTTLVRSDYTQDMKNACRRFRQ